MPKIPKNKLNPELRNKARKRLLDKIMRISSTVDLERFLDIFFTAGEKDLILRRMGAMILLEQGERYRDIKERLEISGNTLSYVGDIMRGRGYGRRPEREKGRVNVAPKRGKRFRLKYKGAPSLF